MLPLHKIYSTSKNISKPCEYTRPPTSLSPVYKEQSAGRLHGCHSVKVDTTQGSDAWSMRCAALPVLNLKRSAMY